MRTAMLYKLVAVLAIGSASALKLPASTPTPQQQSSLNRRSFAAAALLGGLALPLEANAAEGAKPIWAVRKDGIEKPTSVTKDKCDVEKPCPKGATLWGPWSELGAKDPSQQAKPKKDKKK